MAVRIRVDKTKKSVGDYSLFVSFDFDYSILDLIKALPSRIYLPESKEWEVPTLLLPRLERDLTQEGVNYGITGLNLLSKPKVIYDYDFKTKPLNHQLDMIDYGLKKDSFLLGDDMGLGKSKEALDLALIRKSRGQVSKVLIICGVNALKWNWVEEVKKHTNEGAWILGQRKNRKGKIVIGNTNDKIADIQSLCGDNMFMITNIETLRNNDFIRECRKQTDSGKIQMIILDEAHCCKNHKSAQTKGLLKLHSKYQLPMSGTFMLNRPLDLYVPLNWIGYYKDSYYKFQWSFVDLDEWGNINGLKNMDLLRNMVADCMLRRKKEEVIDLPEKTYINEYLEMTDAQEAIYDEVITGLKANIDKIRLSHNPLLEMLRARQATGYPGLLSTNCTESIKLNRLVSLVDEIQSNGYKCLVFSNWTQMVEAAAGALSRFNPAKITGEYNEQIVESEKHKFKTDSSCKVCVGTIGKMGTGLTLTEANYVIFLDEPWNKGVKEQASDRVHRIGQKNNVTIITLICKNTIDERIYNLVEQKGFMSDMLIDGKTNRADIVDYLLS